MLFADMLGSIEILARSGDLSLEVCQVTRDSRDVRAGTVFVAIEGAHFDGHDALTLLPTGAMAVVEKVPNPSVDVPWVQVADTRAALAALAAAQWGHPSEDVAVVGVTGTNGKTTVTTLLQQALEAEGLGAARIGTTGTRVLGEAVPTALTTPEPTALHGVFARLRDGGGGVCAMEVSSIGLVQRRADAIAFAVGVFTNLSRDHLDVHGSMDAYAAAKAMLFSRLRSPGERPRALLCGDDPAWRQMGAPEDRWLYGFSESNDVRIVAWETGVDHTRCTLDTPMGQVVLTSPMVGRFNALNVTAAWAAGVLAGAPSEALVRGLSKAPGPPGRLERVSSDRGPFVVVDYAHTPDALANLVPTVRRLVTGAVWLVFGCGGDRDAGKRPEMGRAALAADHVIVTSDNPRHEDPEAIIADVLRGTDDAPHVTVCVDRRDAIVLAIRSARPEDAVIIAGKGHETTQEIAGHKQPFDDRVVATAALEAA